MVDQVMRAARLSLAVVGAAVMLVAPSAQAQDITSLLIPNAINTFTDNDAELFVNKAGGATTVDVGDIFLGAIEIDTVNNVAIGTTTANNELSGVFGVQVTSVTNIGGGLAIFTFEAVGDLQAEFLAATGVDIGDTSAGTFGLFWEDDTPDALRDGNTFAGFTTQVIDGELRLILSMDAGDISATGLTDLTDINNVAPGAGLPISFFGTPGPDIAFQDFGVELFGPIGVSGNAQRPVSPEDFTIRTDTTLVTQVSVVPNPGAISLLGGGLLAIGLLRLRKSR